jgi:hypothetical protein
MHDKVKITRSYNNKDSFGSNKNGAVFIIKPKRYKPKITKAYAVKYWDNKAIVELRKFC